MFFILLIAFILSLVGTILVVLNYSTSGIVLLSLGAILLIAFVSDLYINKR